MIALAHFASGTQDRGILYMLLIIVGVIIITTFMGKALLRKHAPPPREGVFTHGPSAAARAHDDLQQVLVQIQEISREQIARLDSKIRILTQLLADADAKIRTMEDLLKRPEAGPKPRETPPVNPLHAKVFALHDQNRPVAEICEATGLEKGEVDLILGMRSMKS